MTPKNPKKLGELLVQEKVITPDQLEEVLTKQSLYGTRIGSTVTEMGFAEEEHLVKLLGDKLGVPFAGRKQVYSVSKELIDLFSRDLAFKYHAVPFKLERNRLCIAMVDPSDLKAIDEIAFITGYVVQPHIALDVHVSRAMAKYYRISSKEMQYQQMADKRKRDQDHSSASAESPTLSARDIPEAGSFADITAPFEGFLAMGIRATDDIDTACEASSAGIMERLSKNFAQSDTRDQVADYFSDYMAQEFCCGSLFIVRGTVAVGWRGVNRGKKIDGITDFNLLLSKPSVLRDVVESREMELGTVVNTPENRHILTALGLKSDAVLLVLPLIMLNKVVAAVMISDDMGVLQLRLAELQKIVNKAALAFEMLIIKKKILLT